MRRILQLPAGGLGMSGVAKLLIEEGAAAPRAQQRLTGLGPAPSGAKPRGEWVMIDAPQLNIVAEALWDAARGRLDRRAAYFGGSGCAT